MTEHWRTGGGLVQLLSLVRGFRSHLQQMLVGDWLFPRSDTWFGCF